jgi:hypothetical protein
MRSEIYKGTLAVGGADALEESLPDCVDALASMLGVDPLECVTSMRGDACWLVYANHELLDADRDDILWFGRITIETAS